MNPTLLLRMGIGALALGCTGPADNPDPTPGDGGSYTSTLGPEPDFSRPSSALRTTLWHGFGQVELSGAFAEAPPLTLRSETAREGSCRLVTSALDRCSPACDWGSWCVDGTCQEHPARVDRGALTWTWPGGEQVVEPQDELLGYYASASLSVPGDDPGRVGLTGDGLDLDVPAPPALEPAEDWSAQLQRWRPGEEVVLRWDNPVQHGRVRLFMTDCTGSHGGVGEAEIECEGPDTGSLTVPSAFMDALAEADWSRGECGSHRVERFHASAPEGDPDTRLEALVPADLFWRPDF